MRLRDWVGIGLLGMVAVACGDANEVGAFATIDSGSNHKCAGLANGTVRCWGDNAFRQLGDGTTTDRHTPVTVTGITDAVAITIGHDNTCALLADRTAKCWAGETDITKILDKKAPWQTTPVDATGITDAVAITAGWNSTCVVLADGRVRCWGSNGVGQLGDGTTTDRHTPVTVTSITDAVAITVGGGDACALLADGTARCWGSNETGDLGDGTTAGRQTPVDVAGSGPG